MPSPSRSGGLLLHLTSLPGRFGVGDLGPGARRFVDFLERAGLGLWQILPLGPTGQGASPYTATSTFAGNPLLISPERLREGGLLAERDLAAAAVDSGGRVDFETVRQRKHTLLHAAFDQWEKQPGLLDGLDAFREENDAWLGDYTLFAALREAHGPSWTAWPAPLRRREEEALRQAREAHAQAVRRHVFWQFLFDRQWQALRAYAAERSVRFFGDLPIYLAHGSADVWANQERFQLDADGQPTAVAGVPPDHFSETGQRWGNPLYRWDRMQDDGFTWWVQRLRHAFRRVDVLRIDHFRAFSAYWHVPAEDETALNGHWEDGPGRALFDAVDDALGSLNGSLDIVAEDLGTIDDDVRALMRQIEAPGMAVLLFGLMDGPESAFLPHHHRRARVAYTGTHDNNTFAGWYAEMASAAERRFAQRYLGLGRRPAPREAARAAVRATFASVARRAVVPVQDVLGLGNAARMNTPGTVGAHNWTWRLPEGALTAHQADRLAELAALFDREAGAGDEEETDADEEAESERVASSETERVA